MGAAICADWEYYKANAARIARDRDAFAAELRGWGWEIPPSLANFVLMRKKGYTGRFVYESIRERGILVRHFDQPGISDFVRVTIGTAEQMRFLSAVIKELFGVN